MLVLMFFRIQGNWNMARKKADEIVSNEKVETYQVRASHFSLAMLECRRSLGILKNVWCTAPPQAAFERIRLATGACSCHLGVVFPGHDVIRRPSRRRSLTLVFPFMPTYVLQ